MKKATLKDIAKAVDVSVATVSYVLNNVANQTIPEETKCRVLQAAKELNYVPNLAARSLVKQKTGLIGILINRARDEKPWSRLRYAALIDCLERQLTDKGYHVILSSLDAASPKLDIISERKLDGVFVVDVRSDTFHLISSFFSEGVPLIVIDSLIDDPLFYKIVYDYEHSFQQAVRLFTGSDSYLIVDDRNNQELLASIQSLSSLQPESIHIMKNEAQLQQFLSKQIGRHGIVINEYVALTAAKYTDPSTLTVLCTAGCPELLPRSSAPITYRDRQATAALELMLLLLHNPIGGPTNKHVRIQAE